ncbi:hypothetical protein LCGC14_3065540, partial [marine sediment metagenome]
ETIQKILPFFLAGVVVIWLVCAGCFYAQALAVQRWSLVILGAVMTYGLIFLFRERRISYEVSATTVVKKLGKRILCTIELRDVQGFIAKGPICLKVTGRKDFIFRGIGIKSSREKLLSVLRELEIPEIKRKPFSFTQIIVLIVSVLCIVHFAGSILMWVVGTIYLLKICWVGVDWPMFIHFIPAVLLLGTSILATVFAAKKRKKAVLILAITVVASIICCLYETRNHFYQDYPKTYFTWWWYEDVFSRPVKHEFTRSDYKYGYIDKTGQVVIEPQFDFADEFSEGLACVGVRGRIDSTEKDVVTRRRSPTDEFIGINRSYFTKYGFIDRSGKIIVEPKFDHAESFSEGLAWV